MAEKITINDFVRWTTEQIHPAELSALMSKYGYTDDSHESIHNAIESSTRFRSEYGSLLSKSVAKNKKENSRQIGGVGIEDDSLTIEDWKGIVRSKSITRASGTNIDTSESGTTTNKSFWDYFSVILGTAGGVATSIWGKEDELDENDNNNQQSGSNTFLYIIIVVVLIAVVGIVWVSTSKK